MIDCKFYFISKKLKRYVSFSFFHPNPDDPKEVPGGFLSDINKV
jgi:hypothetical protein